MNTTEIKARIKSIKQTVQIANAQKLIASSRVGAARHKLEESNPFHERIMSLTAELLHIHPKIQTDYIKSNDYVPTHPGYLVLASDTGLAGGYNSNLAKFAAEQIAPMNSSMVIVQGNPVRNSLKKHNFPVDTSLPLSSDIPTLHKAGLLVHHIIQLFETGVVDGFGIIYTKYYSAVKLKPVRERLFPLPSEAFGEPTIDTELTAFEPSPEDVINMLLPKYLKGYVYGCLVHAYVAELTARITAMESAISNGNEMLDKLSLAYNRARQADITQEITEIVAGATAMEE